VIAVSAGLVAGFIHVLAGPDHLAAVAPLTFNNWRRALAIGFRWGIGHSSGVLFLGYETQRFDQFSYGVSDRGASIRIPWQVAVDKQGYLEDRRPNANIDPYVVARLMVETVCGAMK
jgi:hypothetical protein